MIYQKACRVTLAVSDQHEQDNMVWKTWQKIWNNSSPPAIRCTNNSGKKKMKNRVVLSLNN